MIAAFVAALVLAQETPHDTASSMPRWSLRIEPARCLLEARRHEPMSTLSIDTVPGSDSYRVAIAGNAIKGSTSFAPATLAFAPSRKELKGLSGVTKLPDGTPVILMQGISAALLDDLANADSVTMMQKNGNGGAVAVANGAKAVDALRRCEVDQLVAWGADPAQFEAGGKLPIALKGRSDWISNKDLVAISARSKRYAIESDFLISISTSGVIDDCHAIVQPAEKDLEEAACHALIGKSLFSAGKDANGRTVRGVATFHLSLLRRTS